MPAEEVSYEALMNRWRRERSTPTLTKIDPGFYLALEAHLRALSEDYQRESGVNPAAPKAVILQDELRNLQRARDDFYDLREKKIAVAALIGARGGNPDRANMTKGEQELFDEILRAFRDARKNLLKRGEREAAVVPPPPVSAHANPAALLDEMMATTRTGPEPALTTFQPAEAAPAEAAAPAPHEPTHALVRVTTEIEPFVASDLKTYQLAEEDVASLPRDTARALVMRGKAEPIGWTLTPA
ncbi:MAG TPA: hypothetical protein VM889_14250 [Candidatus Thermoplasmatota archaeon]|nr:hypothetical protein [Candidatus Thermoplasmatota archaeon]